MANGDETKVPEGETKVEVPQEELAFTQLLQKFGIGTKSLKTETIAENISRTGGERVFEYPERLAGRLATWHEYISPVKRKQILEQWFSEKGVEVPEEALKTAGLKTSEIKEKEKEEETRKAEEEKRKAKFFVETDTGAIRAAKGEETPLTMTEAETISDRIKTGKKEAKAEEEAKAKAEEGGKEEETRKAEEEKRKAKFFVETDTGAIRAAKGEETPLTMTEAETISDRIKTGKKEAKAEEEAKAKAEEGGKESPFTLDSEGHWQLNPNAKISGMELLAFEAVKKSQEKGETADPFEILAAQAKSIETMRSVFGGGREGGGFLDSVDDLIKLKNLLGTDEDTKTLLAGIYKKLTDTGEGKGESEDVKGLRDELKSLREDLQKKERERLEERITSLNAAISEVRGDLAKARSESRATDEYGIMGEAIKVVDRRLGALEGMARGAFGKAPGLLPSGVKKELTQAISKEAVEAQALDKLAEAVFYS